SWRPTCPPSGRRSGRSASLTTWCGRSWTGWNDPAVREAAAPGVAPGATRLPQAASTLRGGWVHPRVRAGAASSAAPCAWPRRQRGEPARTLPRVSRAVALPRRCRMVSAVRGSSTQRRTPQGRRRAAVGTGERGDAVNLEIALPEVVDPLNGIRTRLLALKRDTSRHPADMAELLADVYHRRLFAAWGHTSFAAYVLEELELLPKLAYQWVITYRIYERVWDQARHVAWNRLVEAGPLVLQGGWKPEGLVPQLAEASAAGRVIRDWKAATLKIGEPLVVPAGEGRILKVVPTPRAGDPDVVIHPDMELLDAYISNGTQWVKVTLTLPQTVLLMLIEVCSLARERLGIQRAPEDDRWTLPAELEALCQEVGLEWR